MAGVFMNNITDNLPMRKLGFVTIPFLMIAACSVPNRFLVTDLGYEPQETSSTLIYALPQTGLKVQIDYRKEVFVPGPYADYAQRMLGIEGAGKMRTEAWYIDGAGMENTTEPDLSKLYTVSGVEGNPGHEMVKWAEENDLIIRGDYRISTEIGSATGREGPKNVIFKDVTMEPNEEKKEQTIYKTLITDTSFVKVPVTTEQMERKTIERKAEEAARLILQIRSDRYYLSAGLVDPLPADFDLETALAGLDRLEAEYLSLFIGKFYTEHFSKKYFLLPAGSLETERYTLDLFSEGQGMGAEEGSPVELMILPDGEARSLRNLLPQQPETDLYNHFYYRIPETCDVILSSDGHELARSRISIYQSGALVREKVSEE